MKAELAVVLCGACLEQNTPEDERLLMLYVTLDRFLVCYCRTHEAPVFRFLLTDGQLPEAVPGDASVGQIVRGGSETLH